MPFKLYSENILYLFIFLFLGIVVGFLQLERLEAAEIIFTISIIVSLMFGLLFIRILLYIKRRFAKIVLLLIALYFSYQLIPSITYHSIIYYYVENKDPSYIVENLTTTKNFPYVIDLSKSYHDKFTFCIVGDSGNGSIHQYNIAHEMSKYSPKFILHTGDVVYKWGREEKYEDHFIKPYKKFILNNILFYPAIGNHDYYDKYGQAFFSYFSYLPNRYYQLRTEPLDIFALDSNTLIKRGIDLAQISWLESRLKESNKKWKVVYLHHLIFSSGQNGDNKILIEALKEILEREGVNLVISGHDHDYERIRVIHGVRYIVSGGGGGKLREQKILNHPYSEIFLSKYHFLNLNVNKSHIDIQVIDEFGDLIDSFQIGMNNKGQT